MKTNVTLFLWDIQKDFAFFEGSKTSKINLDYI